MSYLSETVQHNIKKLPENGIHIDIEKVKIFLRHQKY